MGLPQTPSPPHLYPQALQLKLYQAFIFSIPILFSIILFLLFYLFYLKKRASSLSPPPPILPRTSNQPTPFISLVCEVGLKGELKDKLPKIVFDEDLRAMDSLCCVCLGEFEIKEELLQVPSCKHVFHVDCIRHWLRSNSTCPLCRCSVAPPQPPVIQSNLQQDRQRMYSEQQQLREEVSSSVGSTVPMGGSSSSSSNACLIVSHEMGHLDQSSAVILHIQD